MTQRPIHANMLMLIPLKMTTEIRYLNGFPTRIPLSIIMQHVKSTSRKREIGLFKGKTTLNGRKRQARFSGFMAFLAAAKPSCGKIQFSSLLRFYINVSLVQQSSRTPLSPVLLSQIISLHTSTSLSMILRNRRLVTFCALYLHNLLAKSQESRTVCRARTITIIMDSHQ